jgi:hypothetical protein
VGIIGIIDIDVTSAIVMRAAGLRVMRVRGFGILGYLSGLRRRSSFSRSWNRIVVGQKTNEH